eukprot:m.11238 g.11238  ORF g.11238 m.11238 type:complete len:260 (+) comp23106_c0_seq2:149-928(+)
MSSKVCVVFGGSRGIGRAICLRMASEGYCVVNASRNPIKTVWKVHSPGRPFVDSRQPALFQNKLNSHIELCCDVSDESAVKRAARKVTELFGRVDVLVNAAGINRDSLLVRASHDDLRRQIDINLVGSMLTCKAFLPVMLKRREGAIVNIGSVAGLVGREGQCGYAASKAGLVGFSRSLAQEVAGRGISVNLVAPGFIETDMTDGIRQDLRKWLIEEIPLKRFGNVDEVASVVHFAATNASFTGQVFVVDGGLSCAMSV